MSELRRISAYLAVAIIALSTLALPGAQASNGGTSPMASAEWNVIKGYMKENVTNDPVQGAYAVTQIENSDGNFTQTDAAGYYEVFVADGTYGIFAASGGHDFAMSNGIVVSGKTVRWLNFTLEPAPARTSIVKGYLNDSVTMDPLKDVEVVAPTPPQSYPIYANLTKTDPSGFYQMAIIPGNYELFPARIFTHYANKTTFSVASGQTAWVNLSLDPILFKGKIKGYVNETQSGNLIPGARIGAKDSTGHENYSLTDTNGYYELDMTTGDLDVRATAFRHLEDSNQITLANGATVWLNFTLAELVQNAVLRGYVQDNTTKKPLSGAYVGIENQTYKNSTSTNATGFYELYSSAGKYTQIVFIIGYYIYFNQITMTDGKVMWVNVSLDPSPPETAVVQGYIKDAITGSPIPNAKVEMSNQKNWFNNTNADATGYYKMNAIPVHMYLRASENGYYDNSTDFDLMDGQAKWANLSLYPQLPQNVTLKGYVKDLSSSQPIPNARIQISGYPNQENETQSNQTGYYEMMVVQAKQDLFVTAQQHAPNSTTIDPMGNVLWLNFSMEQDTTPPSLSQITIQPRLNISVNRSTQVNGSVFEKNLKQDLVYLAEYRNGSGVIRNFTARVVYSSVDNPDAFPVPTRKMTFVYKGSDRNDWNFTWDATTDGGLLGNASGREYVNVLKVQWSPEPIVLGYYKNATMPNPLFSLAYFNMTSGKLKSVLVNFTGMNWQVTPSSDPTGMFGSVDLVWTVNIQQKQVTGVNIPTNTMFPITDESIIFENKVNSGAYSVIEQASDWGDNNNMTVDWLMVDNDAPVADAGKDITVFAGKVVTFNGSASDDNVGITNYTWTFFDVANKTLYGESPNYTFASEGIYNVTLTVTDGANNTANDTISVSVTTPLGFISGKVTGCGNSIVGATVTLYLAGTKTIVKNSMTDVSGNFNLTNLLEGIQYDIRVQKANYNDGTKNGIQANASGIIIDLQCPPGHISGKVTSGSTPIQGAIVKAYDSGTTGLVDQVTTDANGNYDLTKLNWSKKYDINVTATGYVSSQKNSITANATGIDFDLKKVTPPPPAKGWITGSVRDAETNDAIPQASITVLRNGTAMANATTDSIGKFNVSVGPGTYSVEIKKSGYDDATRPNVVVSSGKENLLTVVLVKKTEEIPMDMTMIAIAIVAIIAVVVIAMLMLLRRKKEPEASEEDAKEGAKDEKSMKETKNEDVEEPAITTADEEKGSVESDETLKEAPEEEESLKGGKRESKR